jgi:hypothetical protein
LFAVWVFGLEFRLGGVGMFFVAKNVKGREKKKESVQK